MPRRLLGFGMALKLCAGCERHVRERDELCPYCGETTSAKVRVPSSHATRSAMFAGVGLMVVAAVEGACGQAVYGAPVWIDPKDDAAVPNEASVDSAFAYPDAAKSACFENLGDEVIGLPPTAYRDVCTSQDIADAEAVCLVSVHTGQACSAWTGAHPSCARCLLGALRGELPTSTPLPALIPKTPDALTPSLAACAALVLGRPECALPVSRTAACVTGSCTTCEDDSTRATCKAQAEGTACRTPIEVECTEAIRTGFARWDRICQGANAGATYTKVATYLCGPPPAGLDAGGD